MEFPDDLKFTKQHEWVRVEKSIATVGITDYAQEKLGDIVYVELPREGEEVEKDEPFGVVESTKAVSDIYAPLSGAVTEVNDSLSENPATLNEDAYEEGWLIKLRIDNHADLEDLMDAEQYQAYIKEQE